MEDLYIHIGKNIKALRIISGETQEQLGKIINIGANGIYFYEKGERKIPISHLNDIAYHYGVSVDDMINEEFIVEVKGVASRRTKKGNEELLNLSSELIKVFNTSTNDDLYYKKAYELMERIFENIINNILTLESMVNLCINNYLESIRKFQNKKSAANLFAFILLVGLSYNKNIINVGKAFLNNKDYIEYLLKNPSEREKEEILLEKTKSFFRKNQDFLYESIKELKKDNKWSQLGDYNLALCYIFGVIDNELDNVTNSKIGQEIMESLLYVDNIYAAKFTIFELNLK